MSRLWQDVVVRLRAWRAWVKHREIPWVIQGIRVCHAEASLRRVTSTVEGMQLLGRARKAVA